MNKMKLNVVSTVDAVCDALRNDIYSCYFLPGSKISETDITTRYDVSRNTFREAVVHLISDGILAKTANKGVFVRKLTIEDLREIFYLRGLLEKEAIRKIIGSGDFPTEILEALKKVEMHDPYLDWDQHIEADINFHDTLVRSSGSSRLMRLYRAILSEVRLALSQSHRIVVIQKENALHHRVIAEAIQQRNFEKAVGEMDRHIRTAIINYESGYLALQSDIKK